MKIISSAIALFMMTHAQAQSFQPWGGKITSNGEALFLTQDGKLIHEKNTDQTPIPNLHFPMESGQDAYQTRWGLWLSISENAALNQNPIPEWRYLILVRNAKKSFREGLITMESIQNKGKSHIMTPKHFNLLMTELSRPEHGIVVPVHAR